MIDWGVFFFFSSSPLDFTSSYKHSASERSSLLPRGGKNIQCSCISSQTFPGSHIIMRMLPDVNFILKNPAGSALIRQLVETSVAGKSKLRSQRSSATFYRVTCALPSFGLKSGQPFPIYFTWLNLIFYSITSYNTIHGLLSATTQTIYQLPQSGQRIPYTV